MAFITLRQSNVVTSPGGIVKGAPLTNAEVDNNFANINLVIGFRENLITPDNDNLVAAVNQVFSIANSIATANIQNNAVTTDKIADANVTTAKIADANVTTAKIADANVTTAKIADANVTTAKIADANVTTAKIADANVTTSKLSLTGVDAGSYGNGLTVASFVVGVDGRITSASNVAIEVSGGGGGGSGLFNTAINGTISANITDSMENVFVAPSTIDKRYIIHSIHVTNVDANLTPEDASITGQFVGSTYSDITYATSVPLPGGSSVELLKKPKILQPNDAIQLQANGNSKAWVTVTYEESNEIEYFGQGVDLTSSNTYFDLYVASANSVVESILLSNDSSNLFDVKSTVVYTDSSNTIVGYFAFNLVVPVNSTVEILEQPKFIEDTYKVRVLSLGPDRLESIIAGKEIT